MMSGSAADYVLVSDASGNSHWSPSALRAGVIANIDPSVGGSNIVYDLVTGSYTSAFTKYTIASESNARSGHIMAVWKGSSVRSTEVTTIDVGDTTAVTMNMDIPSTQIRLVFDTPNAGWTIKTLTDLL